MVVYLHNGVLHSGEKQLHREIPVQIYESRKHHKRVS